MNVEEKKIYDIANDSVDSVGESTTTRFSVTHEDYVMASLVTDSAEEIVPKWTEWIKSYCIFAKGAKPEGHDVEQDPTLNIYWREEPEIECHDGVHHVFARLLVSRLKYDPRVRYLDV